MSKVYGCNMLCKMCRMFKIYYFRILFVILLFTVILCVFDCYMFTNIVPLTTDDKKLDLDSYLGLPSALMSVNMRAKNIFFAETNMQGELNAEQSCAVESAARANPDWQINVFFLSKVKNKPILKKLVQIGNIKFAQISITEFSSKTPLRELILTNSSFNTNEDVVRFLTLFHFEGVFLDLNVVVVRPILALPPNWFVKYKNTYVEAEPIALSGDVLGRKFSRVAIRILNKLLKDHPNDRTILMNLGREVVTMTLKFMCTSSYVPTMDENTCKGFKFYSNKQFPVSKLDHRLIFQPSHMMFGESFVIQVDSFRNNSRLFNYYYPHMAIDHCPTAYSNFGYDAFVINSTRWVTKPSN